MSVARSADPGASPHSSPGGEAEAGHSSQVAIAWRLDSIDLLRGLVMIVMALDHTRDFFSGSDAHTRDVTEPALFLTRWITHFCAPTFIFLAGVSAFLYGTRGRSKGAVSGFLLTRGLFLILLEVTVLRVGWTFEFASTMLYAGVIWAIGASMIALAGLLWLPRPALTLFAIVMIAGHNLLDGVHAEALGLASWLWIILHEGGLIRLDGASLSVSYPLIPWIGVMAAGYCLGLVFEWEAGPRRRFLAGLGSAVVLGFVALRVGNLYGDPVPWQVQASWVSTVLSFINCEKYPPSLLYLTMTLGPALVLLAAFESVRGRIAGWITVYGRVPLFYYIAHVYLLHLLAVLTMMAISAPSQPENPGLSLPGVDAVWIAVVAMLWPLCRWYAALKAGSRQGWLSYL